MFRRKNEYDASHEQPAPEPKPDGKGRPTPTRKEAEAARKAALKTPASRKDTARAERERRSKDRVKIREAMTTGDDRYLPPRDKGPVRRLVRNVVDSRRNVGEYLMPILVIILLVSLVRAPWAILAIYVLWVTVILGTIVDSFLLVRRVKREVAAKFPDASTRGLTTYAIMRSTQIRRLRLPKPQVSHGESY
ncbi:MULTISPECIES: DUF3043 domain-containing protein [Mumia]|uniref:DUF3043 domain-containing protein n=1 Tax=Mumia TaxID=1546255 RepID=UPI001422E3AD|nr:MULTISPECIES: DUF3043 domain-containing protein [unclassified Mumia]QMW67703.1 DUF3043 domain-containing protein [Mumia sp. ZJ1417]